jgi:hypothetical protein
MDKQDMIDSPVTTLITIVSEFEKMKNEIGVAFENIIRNENNLNKSQDEMVTSLNESFSEIRKSFDRIEHDINYINTAQELERQEIKELRRGKIEMHVRICKLEEIYDKLTGEW